MDREHIKAAIRLLIETRHYSDTKKAILRMAHRRETAPMRFTGDMESLNTLVELGARSSAALDSVFALVERARRGVPVRRKVDYQRDYMRHRRERIAKVIKIDELIRGAKMSATEREAFADAVLATWMAQRDEYIAKKAPQSWQEKNAVVAEFWRSTDEGLDRQLYEAHQAAAKKSCPPA